MSREETLSAESTAVECSTQSSDGTASQLCRSRFGDIRVEPPGTEVIAYPMALRGMMGGPIVGLSRIT